MLIKKYGTDYKDITLEECQEQIGRASCRERV